METPGSDYHITICLSLQEEDQQLHEGITARACVCVAQVWLTFIFGLLAAWQQ